MIKPQASQISPRPVVTSAAVASTHKLVVHTSSRFLLAEWSAMAPSSGAVMSTSR